MFGPGIENYGTSGCVQDRLRLDLSLARGQFSYQPERNGQFIKLEVRTKESHRAINARLARYLRHVDPRFAQRTLSLGCGGSRIVRSHILCDPAVQESLRLFTRHKAADLIAHHRFEVV